MLISGTCIFACSTETAQIYACASDFWPLRLLRYSRVLTTSGNVMNLKAEQLSFFLKSISDRTVKLKHPRTKQSKE